MKYLIIPLLLFLVSCSDAQQKHKAAIPVDSLKKYSYQIIGIATSNKGYYPIGGTVFFIRNNNKVFLITAKHVLTGCDDNNKKIEGFPRFLYVQIHDTIGAHIDFMDLDVTVIRDTSSCLGMAESPDIISVEIKSPKAQKVFSVESFIQSPFKEINKVVMYGFPGKIKTQTELEYLNAPASHVFLNVKDSAFLNSRNSKGELINYWIRDTTLNETLESQHGYSGSPIFIKDAKTNEWRIGGAYAGFAQDTVNLSNKYLIVPRLENVWPMR